METVLVATAYLVVAEQVVAEFVSEAESLAVGMVMLVDADDRCSIVHEHEARQRIREPR